MTCAVDWALKANYLSIYLSKIHSLRRLIIWKSTVNQPNTGQEWSAKQLIAVSLSRGVSQPIKMQHAPRECCVSVCRSVLH